MASADQDMICIGGRPGSSDSKRLSSVAGGASTDPRQPVEQPLQLSADYHLAAELWRQAKEPLNTWKQTRASEYGFYANVNPDVDHPRWSQKTERRIGELFRRKTLPFNGYADHVASLYAGMDLRKYY
jgi:hypothetical protein